MRAHLQSHVRASCISSGAIISKSALLAHSHWVARNDEFGAVVISIEKVKDRRMRVLIRTKRQDERMLLPPNSKKKLALVLDVYPAFAPLKFKKVRPSIRIHH